MAQNEWKVAGRCPQQLPGKFCLCFDCQSLYAVGG